MLVVDAVVVCFPCTQELQLCEQYDAHMADWERRLDKIESSSKKK